jgi:hypothetical protein
MYKAYKLKKLRSNIYRYRVAILFGIAGICMSLSFIMQLSVSDEPTIQRPGITGVGHEIIVGAEVHTYIAGEEVTIEMYQDSLNLRADGIVGHRTVSETVWSNNTIMEDLQDE